MRLGVVLVDAAAPIDTHADIAGAARYAESVGIASLWVGDHLALGTTPLLDPMMVLAAACSATSRIELGTAAFVPSLRPTAWAAKQVATMVQLAGPRFLLGVAVGAGMTAEHELAGFPAERRGRRTDEFLEALPALLGGGVLSPRVPVPDLWIGGSSAAARRRVERFDAGWLAGLVTPAEFRAHEGRRALVAHVTFGARTDAVDRLRRSYGLDRERAEALAIAGTPAQVAEQLSAYDAAEHVVLIGDVGPWARTCDLVAEVRDLSG